MASALQRGFKAEAEKISIEIRSELALGPYDQLRPSQLAEHYGIPIIDITALRGAGAPDASLDHFLHGAGQPDFSAATILAGSARVILVNPSHSRGRQTNSTVHEVSHVVLEHEPTEVLSVGGCRRWDARKEEEADWLAGALLVPREAALAIVRRQKDLDDAALHFGVSRKLLEWRLNQTGVRLQVQRETKRFSRPNTRRFAR